MSKFTKISPLEGWKILSDKKYVKAKKIAQTEKYKILYLKTDKNSLKCADNHIVFDENFNEIFVKDLTPGTMIVGKDGLETVLSVTVTDEYENMYDVEVDDDCHRYFTNGILSDNTTTVTCFLLHYILFNFDKKVAVLANKGSMAREILSRIQLGYINLPKWIQSGIKSWNKGSIELENGCSIIAAATSSDSVRGSSFSCIFIDECIGGDSKITVRNKKTGEIEQITMEEFYNRLK